MLAAWKHKEGNRHRDRKKYLVKLQGVAWETTGNNSLNDSKYHCLESMFPIKRTVCLCTVTLVKNTVHLIGNIEYLVTI